LAASVDPKQTIKIRILAQLVTRAGGEVVSASDY
jgi:hypothetical protein